MRRFRGSKTAAVTTTATRSAHSRDCFRKALVHDIGGQSNDAEVCANQCYGRQRISHTTLEDQVGIHQSVADDGPAEGEWKEDER